MAPTPTKSTQTHYTQIRTPVPSSKHRTLYFNSSRIPHPSPNPSSAATAARENPNNPLPDHPIEVIGRIRDFSVTNKEKPFTGTAFQVIPDGRTIRVRTDIGYQDFSLDGVSSSEEEDIEGFYKKYIESRILGVKLGNKCTIMMYGPTGSGKSHTMFGCPKHPGIVYRSLKDILGGNGGEEEKEGGQLGLFVHVTVLEIYNEEIYDLLSCDKGGGGLQLWAKGSASKVKLEVMGKKAKNATYISGNEAAKISKEIQKVEKRRIVRSTNCNSRSSRSHCMIILDVPTVGGRLMLVDMAGSENIEQAGQIGLEAKMQTAKINQGNTTLKRVVESIANGDSHVPYRDSKLTMLLQDSFEDNKSKILMILCASPDPKDTHKTISTLEYGAKAKCIIRGPLTPVRDGHEDSSSGVILGSRIAAMDQFILKLQMENKQREKECNEAQKQLMKKEEEIADLRKKLEQAEGKGLLSASEDEINNEMSERKQLLKDELEKQLKESQRMAQEYVELEKKRLEEKLLQQQQEMEMLRRKVKEMEIELSRSRDGSSSSDESGPDLETSGLARRLREVYSDDDPSMIKSMDLDMGDQEPQGKEVKIVGGSVVGLPSSSGLIDHHATHMNFAPSFSDRKGLSTVYEEEEMEDEDEEEPKAKSSEDEAVVEKEVIQEKRAFDDSNLGDDASPLRTLGGVNSYSDDPVSSRNMRIQNIFTLCGNYRELSHESIKGSTSAETGGTQELVDHQSSMDVNNSEGMTTKLSETTTTPASKSQDLVKSPLNLSELPTEPIKPVESPIKSNVVPDEKETLEESKENMKPDSNSNNASSVDIYVKWEATKESHGKLVTRIKVSREASLIDLRKLIEIHLGMNNQDFTFLALGDPTGAPISRDKESNLPVSKLPACNNQLGGYLACLRPVKESMCTPACLPLTPAEHKLPITPVALFKQQNPVSSGGDHLSLDSTPFVNTRRRF